MKSSFAAPGIDCSPDGLMILGSILGDPIDPGETLNKRPITIPDSEKNIMRPSNFKAALEEIGERGGGLWFKFLQSLGFKISG